MNVGSALRVTVHASLDPPALWIVYVGSQRVAQFESIEAAEAHAASLRRKENA